MSNNSIWISIDLVLSNTKYGKDESVLIMSGESIDLIEAIAEVAQSVDVFDISYGTVQKLERYVRAANVNFSRAVYPPAKAIYNAAIVFVPKGREFGRAQLWSAMHALKEGGDLYLVGPNKGGAKSLIKDASEMFGSCQVLAYKKSHRVAVSQRQGDYDYPVDFGNVPTETRYLSLETAMGNIEVVTQAGVFSWDELDDGTEFLLEHLDFHNAQTVLDMGCGYGVIGAFAAQQAKQVSMVDDNLLALHCAAETLTHNKLQNATVIASDVFSALEQQKFDLIVSNPPFHKNWDVSMNMTNRLIEEANEHLNPNGRLILVVNAFLKYEQVLSEHFKQSCIRAQNNKYKILETVK